MAKTLYIVRGLPGSGKSTLAKILASGNDQFATVDFGPTIFEADQYFVHDGVDGAVYKFDPTQIGVAHKYCQRRVGDWIADPINDLCIVSNTFTRQWEMEPYRELARKYGYTVVTLTVDSGLTDEQLAARNVHGVPVATIAKMRERWEN